MTVNVLLDTNAYLRLAKRIRPLLGVKFGQKDYILAILKDTEDEVHASPRLQYIFPWFDQDDLSNERLAKRIRLNKEEKEQLNAAKSILRAHVLENSISYTSKGRSPPSPTDCYLLAFGQIRPSIIVTDDLGMHLLADDFDITIWHGHELLKKMLTAKVVDRALVTEIYEALETNNDLPHTWAEVKHTTFHRFFGRKP